MKANLFINYYQDKKPARQGELLHCVLSNIYNQELTTINILVEHTDILTLNNFLTTINNNLLKKVKITLVDIRPTINKYFELTNAHPNDINIISNTDIIISPLSLQKLKSWDWKNYCLALSRWDFVNSTLDTRSALHFNREDSQDTWMAKGSFLKVDDLDFELGTAGIDNSIAFHLSKQFDVINPSLDIKTFHYHLAQARNYKNWRGKVISRVPHPYKMVKPVFLPE